MSIDDALHNFQPQSCALSNRLRGEKRVKDARLDLGRNPWTVIDETHIHESPSLAARTSSLRGGVEPSSASTALSIEVGPDLLKFRAMA